MRKAAAGDLIRRAKAHSNDELGQIAIQLNGSLSQLQSTFKELEASSARLATASGQLLVRTRNNSDAMQKQSTESTEVATAIKQMAASALEIARNVSKGEHIIFRFKNGIACVVNTSWLPVE